MKRILIVALPVCLLAMLNLSGSASAADMFELESGSPGTLPCNPAGRAVALGTSNDAIVTVGTNSSVEVKRYRWDSSLGNWPATTFQNQGEALVAGGEWATGAAGSGGKMYLVRNLSLAVGTAGNTPGNWISRPFDSGLFGSASGTRQSIYVAPNNVWVLYVLRADDAVYQLKLAWTWDEGLTWARATLATQATPSGLGGQIIPWSEQYTYTTTTGTVENRTQAAVFYREGGPTLALRSFVPTDGKNFLEGTRTTNGISSLPSAVGEGLTTLHAVYDDENSGITYLKAQNNGTSPITSWNVTSLGATGETTCTDASSASIGQVEGSSLAVVGLNGGIWFRTFHNGAWQPENYIDAPDGITPAHRPSLAASGYGGRIAIEYVGIDVDGTLRLIFDALGLPNIATPISKTLEVVSPNGDGAFDQTTLSVFPPTPVKATMTVAYPDGRSDTRTCAASYTTLPTCTWGGQNATPAYPSGTYSAAITTQTSAGYTATSTTTFKVDLNAPTGGAITLSSAYSGSTAFARPDNLVSSVSGASDPIAGVHQVQFSHSATDWEGQPWVALNNGSTTIGWPPEAGPDGPRTAYARFRDAVHNVGAVVSDQILIETTSPTGTISAPEQSTSTTISLTMSSTDPIGTIDPSGVYKVRWACDGTLDTEASVSPVASATCTAPSGEGARKIVYQVADLAGNLSGLVNTVLQLDTVGPVSAWSKPPPVVHHEIIPLQWTAVDGLAGVDDYDVEVRNGSGTFERIADAVSYNRTTYAGQLGKTYEFRVRARDNWGNVGLWADRTVVTSAPKPTPELLGGKLQEVCDAVRVESVPDACKIVEDALSLTGKVLWGQGDPKIALVSSGMNCAAFPDQIVANVEGCASAVDPVGYGTWAASVILQAAPDARIVPLNVFAGNRAHDNLVAGALNQIVSRIQLGETFDGVLLAFSPADVLDPTSWAISRASGVPAASGAGSMWDVVQEAMATHPYTPQGGEPVIGLPLDDELRARFFAHAEPRQLAAVNALATRSKTWQALRTALTFIRNAGVPVVAGTGDVPSASAQTIAGLSALPEVITVGPARIDPTGVDRLTALAARGPAPDLSLKPDLLVSSNVTGIVPAGTLLAGLGVEMPPPAWGAAETAAATVRLNGSWSIAAASLAAVDAGVIADLVTAASADKVDVIRGVLTSLASRHQARKADTDQIAAPWEQGAGVLRASLDTEALQHALLPSLPELAQLPVPMKRFDLGGIPVGATKSLVVPFWSGGAQPMSPTVTTSRFLGPNDVGIAVEAANTGATGITPTASGHQITLGAATGSYQGGNYCFTLSYGSYGAPACGLRLRAVEFESDYLYIGGEATEDETFAITPGLPVDVGPMGEAYKFLPLDPLMIPFGVDDTDAAGKVSFDNIPPGFHRVIPFASYDAPGTYSDLEDPTRKVTLGTSTGLSDTWILKDNDNAQVWENPRLVPPHHPLTDIHPPPTFGHATAFDASRNRLVYFGGRTDAGQFLAETWELDLGLNPPIWSRVTTVVAPMPREGAMMAYDSQRQRVVLFGGRDETGQFLNDMWSYTGVWSSIPDINPPIEPRSDGAMVYMPNSDQLLVAGGQTTPEPGSTARKLLQTTWTWSPLAGWQLASHFMYVPRMRFGMAWDPGASRVLAFGGETVAAGKPKLLGDLLAWNGGWSSANPAAASGNPARPAGHGLLAVQQRGSPIAHVPVVVTYTRGVMRTWEVETVAGTERWRLRADPAATPPSRAAYSLASTGTELVLYGGLAPKTRDLGLKPGTTAVPVLFPARTPCSTDPSPNGPLGVDPVLYPNEIELNKTKRCTDPTSVTPYGGVTQSTSETHATGNDMCKLTLDAARQSVQYVYCAPTHFRVAAAVTSRYVDLVKAADWEMCRVGITPGSTHPTDIVNLLPHPRCELPGSENNSTQQSTTWTYSPEGPSCDPVASDGSMSANYSFVSPGAAANPDLSLGILRYRFDIPSPNVYANMNVVFNYEAHNAIVGIYATTGSGSLLSPAAGGLVVSAQPQVSVDPANAISFARKRGTAHVPLQLWPSGANSGDLYVVLAPTSWVTDSGPSLHAAHAEICNLSFEFDTYARAAGPSIGFGVGQDLLDRQLKAPFAGPYTSWTRYGWDPGSASWKAGPKEQETVDFAVHVPKNWSGNPAVVQNDGAYPTALVRAGTDINVVPACTFANIQRMFDVQEGVSTGVLLRAPLSDDINVDDIPIPLRDDWKVNGRFFGVLQVPDLIVRQVPSMDLKLHFGDHVAGAPRIDIDWAGEEDANCNVPWTPETFGYREFRFPAVRFVPYYLPPQKGYHVAASYFGVRIEEAQLIIGVVPPNGEQVTITADLDCTMTTTNICIDTT